MNTVITIIGSVIVFAAVFGFAAYTRYLQHKETMALADKGLLPAENTADRSANILRWGVIFSILGVILSLVMVPFAWNNYWILFLLGLLPLALGLGLTLIYVFAQEDPPAKETKSTAKKEPTKSKSSAAKGSKSTAKKTAKK